VATRLFKVPRFVKWLYPNQVWSFEEDGGVYLTFDDGPHSEITPWLLDYLKSEKITATFFLLGEHAEKYPNLVQTIREHGHDIGNHGHKHLRFGEVSSDEYFENYLKGKAWQTINYFRPPYGKIDKEMAKRIGSESKLAMWSWLSYDYDLEVPSNVILRKLDKQIRVGDILVFHENEHTEKRLEMLLPKVVKAIKSKGLEFKKFPY
jgi:peptidoglycan/xylan/chitin deacetylase (PgdA/CDA1 family)